MKRYSEVAKECFKNETYWRVVGWPKGQHVFLCKNPYVECERGGYDMKNFIAVMYPFKDEKTARVEPFLPLPRELLENVWEEYTPEE